MKNILKLILISFAMVSCENDDQRKIVNNTSDLKTPLEDTSAIIRADLPIEIDSLDYIIHPIGHYRPRKSRLDSYSSYEDSGHYQSFSNYRNYSLDGDLSNLLFQHVDSNELKPLTSKRVNISSMTFLKDIFDETGKKFLVYEIFDQDTNMDGRINSGDIKALYLSNNDGSNLIKLTPNLQELVNWKLIKMNSHLYFKTLEDTDSNGKFDKEDNIHYFNINFNQLELQPKEYHPLEFQG